MKVDFFKQLSKIRLLNAVTNFGPSGVRALPLAAGIHVGGHYKWHFFLFFKIKSHQTNWL